MNSGTKPDFTFYLPDNKTINMDSKFPLNLYMQLSKLNLDLEDETLDEISRKQITESIKTKTENLLIKQLKQKLMKLQVERDIFQPKRTLLTSS